VENVVGKLEELVTGRVFGSGRRANGVAIGVYILDPSASASLSLLGIWRIQQTLQDVGWLRLEAHDWMWVELDGAASMYTRRMRRRRDDGLVVAHFSSAANFGDMTVAMTWLAAKGASSC
jgi:hypothetical protein